MRHPTNPMASLSKPETPRPRQGHGWIDSHDASKERINAQIAELHGPYSASGGVSEPHALYLDGTELHTTRALLKAGWPSKKLHIPNYAKRDFDSIQQTSLLEFEGGLNVYHQSSTDFLATTAAQPWAADVRRAHGGYGPFSVVYLDYTSVEQWPDDVGLLCRDNLMVPGAILAVTCPACAPHIHPDKDVHLRGEEAHPLSIGGRPVRLTGDLAGQAKFEAALQTQLGIHATCLDACTYTSRKTEMWVAIYRVSLPARNSSFNAGVYDFDYQQRMSQTCQHNPAVKLEQKIEETANFLALMGPLGFSLEDGPSATTLEQDLRNKLADDLSRKQNSEEHKSEKGAPNSHNVPKTYPVLLAAERQKREERRQWDFLCAVYTPEEADAIPYIHQDDRAAYAEYKAHYNLNCLRFEGSMLAVDALMSDEPHLRGIGGRVKLRKLEVVELNGRELRGHHAAALNNLEGRIIFEDPPTFSDTLPPSSLRSDRTITVQLDPKQSATGNVKVSLKKLVYHHSQQGYYMC